MGYLGGDIAGLGRIAVQDQHPGPGWQDPKNYQKENRWLSRYELQDSIVIVNGCDRRKELWGHFRHFHQHGRILWASWIYDKAADTQRDPDGTRGSGSHGITVS